MVIPKYNSFFNVCYNATYAITIFVLARNIYIAVFSVFIYISLLYEDILYINNEKTKF